MFNLALNPLFCQTCVSTCFYYDLQILTFFFVNLLGLYKY